MSRISLQNPLASLEQLSRTPSNRDGIPSDLEDDLRNLGGELIQSAGILLKLPQVAMATAQVLFQRFFYMASMKHHGIVEIGMGALFLAAKVEENAVRLTHLVTVYDYLIRRARGQSTFPPLDSFSQVIDRLIKAHEKAYDMKNLMITAEMQILKRLGFNVHVELPYGLMINYLRILSLEEHPTVPGRAWNYLNDGLRTNIYVTHPPSTIACAAIWLACRDQQVKLPVSPGSEWWLLFDTQAEDFKNAAGQIRRLYYQKLDRRSLPLYPKEI